MGMTKYKLRMFHLVLLRTTTNVKKNLTPHRLGSSQNIEAQWFMSWFDRSRLTAQGMLLYHYILINHFWYVPISVSKCHKYP